MLDEYRYYFEYQGCTLRVTTRNEGPPRTSQYSGTPNVFCCTKSVSPIPGRKNPPHVVCSHIGSTNKRCPSLEKYK